MDSGLEVWILPLACVGSAVGAYFGAYLKRKGENLATHEDMNQLVRQVAATTEAQTEIADRSWDRQRVWEMKREAMLTMVQSLGRASDSLRNFVGFAQSHNRGEALWWQHKRDELSESWLHDMDAFDTARFTASFLGGSEIQDAMRTVSHRMRAFAALELKGDNYNISEQLSGIRDQIAKVRNLAQVELGLTGTAVAQATRT